MELRNGKTFIRINDEEKRFIGRDLTDDYNEPSFYNTTRRSFKRAKEALIKAFNDDTTMGQATQILRDNGIRTHIYCAMD